MPQRDSLRSRTGSASVDVSGDGRFVAFASYAQLVPADTDTRADIYVLDVQTRGVTLESALQGEWVLGDSGHPRLNGEGRLLVFDIATDTIAGATVGISATAPVGANGASWDPAISGDGRFVAFVSLGSNLVKGDRNGAADVFLHDRMSAMTTLVTAAPNGRTGNGSSISPTISADGRVVAFQSEASDLLCAVRCGVRQEDTNLVFDVFVRDRATGTVRRVSGDTEGGWAQESGGAALDGGGNVVAFTSRHPIDEADAGNDFDLFVSLSEAASGTDTDPPALQAAQARTFRSLVAFSEYTLRRIALGRPSP